MRGYIRIVDEDGDVRILIRHGDHDQSSHGNRDGGGGSSRGAAKMHREATIRETYSYTDEQSGLTAEVMSVDGGKGSGSPKYVAIQITDRDGNVVGEASRTVHPAGERTVTHETLILDEGVQGQGFATRYNAQVEESYRASGVERVELTANVDVGGYSWARAGYDFRDDQARADVADLARERFGDEFQSVLSNPDSSPIDFAMVGHTPGATTWPGKELMLESTWDGVKNL